MTLEEMRCVPGLAHSKLERHGLHILHVVLRATAEHRGLAPPVAPEGFLDEAQEEQEGLPVPSQGAGGPAWGGPAPLQLQRASLGGADAQAAQAKRAAAAAEALLGVDLAQLDDVDDFCLPPPKAPRAASQEPEGDWGAGDWEQDWA